MRQVKDLSLRKTIMWFGRNHHLTLGAWSRQLLGRLRAGAVLGESSLCGETGDLV